MSAQYTIVVDDAGKWTVTCERCGCDLTPANLGGDVVLFKVPDWIRMRAEGGPEFETMLRERWGAAWDLARATGRPMILDTEIEVQKIEDRNSLERTICAHTLTCK